MKNHYFILRHGETIYQTKKKDFIYPSWLDNPPIKLIEKSKKNLRKLAKKIKKEKIDLIYSSDIFRTRQTAKIVARKLELKINFDKRLRDINLGIYYRKRKEEFWQKFPRYSLKRFSQRPAEGESWLDCQKRMLKFLKEIDKRHKNKNILIISHGDPLWLLEGAVKNWSFKKILKIKKEKGIIKTGELRKLSVK